MCVCVCVYIYIHKEVNFTNINLSDYCKGQDLDITALKFKFNKKKIIIFCVYRAPSRDLEYFFDQLEIIFNSLQNPKIKFILCGDLNINFIRSSHNKTQLDNLLNMHNLKQTISFPTRITTTTATTIDNIFIDKNSNYSIHPYINRLSNHDAQILHLNDLGQLKRPSKFILIRDFNKYNIANFQMTLSYEQWKDVFGVYNVNIMFKNFLNVYLRCYHSTFPVTKKYIYKHTQNEWKTKGIRVSCKRKKRYFHFMQILQ